MAEIAPFKGILYSEAKTGDLSKMVAPYPMVLSSTPMAISLFPLLI